MKYITNKPDLTMSTHLLLHIDQATGTRIKNQDYWQT